MFDKIAAGIASWMEIPPATVSLEFVRTDTPFAFIYPEGGLNNIRISNGFISLLYLSTLLAYSMVAGKIKQQIIPPAFSLPDASALFKKNASRGLSADEIGSILTLASDPRNQATEVIGPLSVAFVIAHELAHLKLGHFSKPPESAMDSYSREFAADVCAAQYILSIAPNARYRPTVEAAVHVLYAIEACEASEYKYDRRFSLHSGHTHPNSRIRLAHIVNNLQNQTDLEMHISIGDRCNPLVQTYDDMLKYSGPDYIPVSGRSQLYRAVESYGEDQISRDIELISAPFTKDTFDNYYALVRTDNGVRMIDIPGMVDFMRESKDRAENVLKFCAFFLLRFGEIQFATWSTNLALLTFAYSKAFPEEGRVNRSSNLLSILFRLIPNFDTVFLEVVLEIAQQNSDIELLERDEGLIIYKVKETGKISIIAANGREEDPLIAKYTHG